MAGLSIVEQVEEFQKSGVEARTEGFWRGRLEDWLSAVLPPGAVERYEDIGDDDAGSADGPASDESVLEWTERRRAGVQTWCFPTDDLRTEYLGSVATRSNADVLALLRLFLFEESCFGGDTEYLHAILRDLSLLDRLPKEYGRRLMRWMSGSAMPHPGVRWALDLLPREPQQAVDAITSYLNVYRAIRPSGRSEGLLDAIAIIRARWINDLTSGKEALFQISPRDLEKLVAALYQKLGYAVVLTPPSRDGGRDVVARRDAPGQREVVQIECKSHASPVGVRPVRELRGVTDLRAASRGVLVTIGRFTRGAHAESRVGDRIELIDGQALIQLLNACFGPLWMDDRAWICRDFA
ncbi:restriction endonuclease [Micromonospora sp. CA-240977]|uniref:restriction endonuclease n=1 Tax=Micromonospora sp. CA-240977 TaxID=3239957 RepID=UPI003D913FE2